MTPELWKRVCEVLAELEPLDAAQRAAELDRLRAAEPTVAAEVGSLLTQQGAPLTSLLASAIADVWERVAEVPHPAVGADADPPQVPGCVLPGGEKNVKVGGMGVVYFGTESDLRRPVAVKVLRRQLVDYPDFVGRFEAEARVCAQLQHPGIVPVHQVGRLADGRPFYTMKLVEGSTLSELLTGRTSPAADLMQFLGYFRRVCEAVAYAHARNVLHRDLKPANVMVGDFGEVLVMDWGIAKVLGEPAVPEQLTDAAPRAVETGLGVGEVAPTKGALGTLAYMSPEQAAGRAGEVDQRSDVFGLGAILCAVLTGRPPYTGETDDIVKQKALSADLTDTHDRLTGCGADTELVALARRCLAPHRADRPADAGAVALAVAKYIAGVEERRRQADLDLAKAEAEVREQKKRRRVQGALAATALLLFASVGGAFWYADHEAQKRAAEKRTERSNHHQAAVMALDQAEVATRKENPVYGEIDAALAQADKRIRDNGLDDLRERYEGLAKDVKMLRRLDEIDDRRWMWSAKSRQVDLAFAQTNYPTAFREYGIDPGAEPPAVLAERVRAARISARLTGALSNWLELGTNANLVELLNHLDPTPLHQELRRAYDARAAEAIVERVARLDADQLPPHFAQFVGTHQLTPKGEALRILVAAQARFPNHFGIAIYTATYWHVREPTRIEERVSAYRIALSIRPENAAVRAALANSLYARGDLDTAIRLFRELIRSDPSIPEPYNDLGLVLTDKGDLAAAIRTFEQAIRLQPEEALIHFNLGRALQMKPDAAGAIRAYREAVRLDPKLARAWANLGGALRGAGELDEAIKACREAIRHDPNLAEGHHNLGVILMDKKDFAGAVAAHKEALRIDTRDAPAHFYLGVALHFRGDRAAAIKAYREAVRLDPKLAKAWTNLGGILVDKKDFAGAVAAHKEAVRLDPGATNRFNLGVALHYAGKTAEAIRAYREALRLDPGFARAWSNLGAALRDAGELDEAIKAHREAIRLDPKYSAAYVNLGIALRDKGDLSAAIEAHQKAVLLAPTDADAHFHLGLSFGAKGNLGRAIRAYRDAIRLNPEYVAAHNNLGVALSDKGDLDGAIEAYRNVIRLDPTDAGAHENLGNALYDKEDFDGAATAYRNAIRLKPGDAGPHNGLGNALYYKGDLGGAIKAYHSAIRLDPTDPLPRYNLGNALLDKRDADGAIAAHKAALRLKPNFAGPHSGLGDALRNKGDADGAIAVYREAIRLKNRWAPTYSNLALLLAARGERSAALRVLREGLRVEPQFVNEYRYDLARFACSIAAGQAKDAPQKVDAPGLRREALKWLSDELVALRKRAGDAQNRSAVHETVSRWLEDPDLRSVRDTEMLAIGERPGWTKLWTDVRKLRDDTAPLPVAPAPRSK